MEETRLRRTASVRQLELLAEFLENHRDLALGRVRSKEGRARALRLWVECAQILNSEGPPRTAKEWSRFWNDYKCRVKAKVIEIRKRRAGTGGGPFVGPFLTPVEERMADIIGRDVGPIPGVAQQPFAVEPQPHPDNTDNNESDGDEPRELDFARDLDLDLNRYLDGSSFRELGTPMDNIAGPSNSSPPSPSTIISRPPPAVHPQAHPTGRNNIAQRRSNLRHYRPPARLHQSNTAALDESRASIARIELIRAESEKILAETARTQSEIARLQAQALRAQMEAARAQTEVARTQAKAAQTQAEAVSSIANSFAVIAKGFLRMSRNDRNRKRSYLHNNHSDSDNSNADN